MTDDTHFDGPPATHADYERFVELFGELGTNDPVPDYQKWLKELAPTTVFLRSRGETLGYAYFNLLGDTAYVRHVVIAPSTRGSGLGRLLMRELASRFRAAGMVNWCLNVKPDNIPAIRLYESVGMKHAHSSCAFRIAWDRVPALPSSDAVGVEAVASDDSAIEAAFGLPQGQLADFRGKSSRVLLWLSRGGVPVGFAAFDPGFPGAFPFRVAPADARALLESMQRHARPEVPYVQVVVENEPPLAQALLDAGAEVRMAFEHYRGSLEAG